MKALADMPVLFRYLEPVMEAFTFLTSSRQLGMGGVGPISLGDIITYLRWIGVSGLDEQRKWARYIRAMDNAYLEFVNKKE